MLKKILDINGPIMQFLLTLFDLMYLQLLTLICCIPLITIGASLTAMHRVCYKLVQQESAGITREFFYGFKTNFKSATPIGLLYLIFLLFLLINNYIVYVRNFTFTNPLTFLLPIIDLFYIASSIWIFIISFRYNNSFFQSICLSFKFFVFTPLQTLLMALLAFLPAIAGIFYESILPVCLLLGLSLPAYISALIYSPILKHIEEISYASKT